MLSFGRQYIVKILATLENQRPRNWPKSFIKASGPAHRSFAVHSGENNENTAKNPI